MTRPPDDNYSGHRADASPAERRVRRQASASVETLDESAKIALDRAAVMLDRLDLGLAALALGPRLVRHFRRKEAVCAIRSRHPRLSLSEPELRALDVGTAAPGEPLGEAAAYAAALERGLGESPHTLIEFASLSELRGLIAANDSVPTPSRPPLSGHPRDGVRQDIESLDRWYRSERDRQPPVLIAASVAARIEALRPFPSGNRRLARLVGHLLLVPAFRRSEPAVYPSLYFTRRAPRTGSGARVAAAPALDSDWIRFYADGIAVSARAALATARRLDRLVRDDVARIEKFGYAGASARRVHAAFQDHPVAAIDRIVEASGLAVQAATRAIHRLRALGVIRETTGRSRGRIFSYREYARMLGAGTEPARE